MINRRTFQLLAAGVILGGSSFATPSRADSKTFRIAFQKGGGNLIFLKERGILESKLAPLGWSVTWTEFQAGPQLLESLNLGAADFGPVGEAPPIFAQAAGANIVYAGYEPASPKNEAIIVQKDSPIRTVADLKGKRVALNKGSNVNYLLVRALEANGLNYGDVVPAYLAPADARAAFERGSVDAWVIWDPYYAAAELSLGARTVVDGTGLAPNVSFYMASRPIAEQHSEVLKAVLSAIDEIDGWIKDNRKQFAIELASKTGLPAEVVERGVNRSELGARPIDAATLEGQQEIADTFARLELIPKAVRVTDAAWKVGQ
ncbi:sulfonate ABC transporter substrate-binding protein [Bradyrhizobium sp. Arg237L]|uniref:sulfonate ABC transporter substrate-binding protein n=1 Tax=Bradyrhizobium sp. Arg237L TaxID=3003352 RepID=UPI00249DF0B3|nr:sulfonate ABC transporter substrate-binding protein [Bradyrhizobium sp. Arg237L]MDI4234065.1 sulfonate ABC transporter substrate-binding protein [Bradyrhizobium sp. Arg237L]